MVRPDRSIVKRFESLTSHLERENPLLLDAIGGFRQLDGLAYRLGLLDTDDSYVTQISWWPLVSVLGVFSAGKSSFLNTYLDRSLQKTGNQAVDDKFSVICYGEDNAGRVLPGIALDADMRFPFYRISDDIERVAEGEGRRIDAYLQLKVTDSPVVKGKILIDSPGFDADEQRTSTLRLTDHIIDISDLVLVFFDARHPEPGAMQDTLTHLVGNTINRADSSKFLYILNQIDTAAREDNTEEIVGAWQRALAQKGLTAGRFYTIFNDQVAQTIDDPAVAERFRNKCNADLAEIHERIDQVEVERAYRIASAMEQRAYEIRDRQVPALTELRSRWTRWVWRFDLLLLILVLLVIGGVAAGLGVLPDVGSWLLSLFAAPVTMMGGVLTLAAVAFGAHQLVRKLVASWIGRGLRKESDQGLARAFSRNTRWFHSIWRKTPVGWNSRARKTTDDVIEQAADFVQSLNDRFTDPAGPPPAGPRRAGPP